MQKSLSTLVAASALIITVPVLGKVIYGKDNRVEVYEATKSQQLNARSAATMIPKKSISSVSRKGLVKIEQTSLKQSLEKNLNTNGGFLSRILSKKEKVTFCKDERFVEQPSPGICSGFLIAPDLIMTAGHCMDAESMCKGYSWVFDFKVDENSKRAGVDVPAENVYSCKKIISSSLMNPLSVDFGIIQLDRKVIGRLPLKVRRDGKVQVNEPLYVVGSPSGLPLKIADGAKVRASEHPLYFTANLDTFQGNSGSAVFNDISGEVEGILVQGDDDFKKNRVLNCIESNRCSDEGCRGERVYRISGVPEIMIFDTIQDAISRGDIETVKEALATNVWIDFNLNDGETALIKAAKVQELEIVKLLINSGADKNHIDRSGKKAIDYVLEASNSSLISILK